MWKKLTAWVRSHPYSYWLTYMLFYLAAFFLLERIVQVRYWIHCPLDDQIPLLEGFILPYLSWLVLMPASLVGYLLYDKEDFLDLCFLMFGGMTIALLVFFLFPNGLQLRMELVRDNFCSRLMGLLYRIDTPTNVCPSIHVSSSVAIAIVTLRSRLRNTHPILAWGIAGWMFVICISTFFVKQHSVIDALCGTAMTVLLCIPVYGLDWRNRLKKTRWYFLV